MYIRRKLLQEEENQKEQAFKKIQLLGQNATPNFYIFFISYFKLTKKMTSILRLATKTAITLLQEKRIVNF